MKNILSLFILSSFLILSGCYAGITGRVIDAETQQPIEGAVVLVEWTKTHGYGFTYTRTYKVFEGFTDKEGSISIPGEYSPFVNSPEISIYKQGYVAWNNHFVFPPGFAERTDFIWENNYVFKLYKFKTSYSYDSHTSFLRRSIGTGLIEQKSNMMKAIRWEEEMAFKERQLNRVK